MTGADLLCAIAASDEKYAYESEQFSVIAAAIKADRKKNRQRLASIGVVVAFCIMVFCTVRSVPQFFRGVPLTETTTVKTENRNYPTGTASASAVTGPTAATEKDVGSVPSGDQASTTGNGNENPAAGTEKPVQTEPTTIAERQELSAQTPQTDVPSTTEKADTPTVPKTETFPTAPSVESSSAVATTTANKEETQNVYQDVIVDYETAKKYFMHPIVSCDRNDFTGYNVLLFGPDGNINESGTICLSVNYVFTNGSVDLRDQDRTGEVYPTGDSYSYGGRTFYVHMPEFNGDLIRVGYFPTGQSGIAYQAFFYSNSDVNDIMDIIISLEL